MAGYSVTFTVVDNATKQLDQINRRMAAMRAPVERMQRSMGRFIDLSGLRKVADGFGWITRMAGMALRTLTAIVPVLGSITGAATIAGMTKLVSSFAQWGNQLQTNADRLGMNADQLQLWQDAYTRAGGSAEDMTQTLQTLHQTMGDAVTGRNAEALGMFKKLGIDIQDANGNLRSTPDVMRDVQRALDKLPSSYDRSKVAAMLLGDAQNKVWETYKQSGMSLDDFLAAEEKHQRLTNEQLQALNNYRLAMSGLETSFSQLGRQVAATLANDLTPLVKALDDWVQTHQPQIVQAVHDVTEAFQEWLKDVNWDQVRDDINGIIKLLRIVLDVAEAVGKAIEKTMFLFGLTNRRFTKEDVLTNSPWYSNLTDEQKKQVRQQVGVTDEDVQKAQQPQGTTSFMEHPLSWLGNQLFRSGQGNAPNAVGRAGDWLNKQTTGTLVDQAARDRATATPGPAPPEVQLPGDYSWGDYGTRANNPGNMNYAAWQHAAGKYTYTDPQTGGAHTMAVYKTMEEGVSDTYKLLARNQEKYGKTLAGALHGWAENSYIPKLAQSLGLDANAEFDISKADPKTVESMMEQQFKREGRRGSHTATEAQILGGIALARGGDQAPPATQIAQAPPAAPPPTAQINGAVNVDITHRNAPPDATVTARGSGSVNVAPPRIEHPQLDFATA